MSESIPTPDPESKSTSNDLARQLENILSKPGPENQQSPSPDIIDKSAEQLSKAEATRQEMVNSSVIDDRFKIIELPQPDGGTLPALGSGDYQVRRSDGRIEPGSGQFESGWNTYIIGQNIVMTKPEFDQAGQPTGHELHKMMPQSEWLEMQQEIFSQRLNNLYDRLSEVADNHQNNDIIDLPGDKRGVVDFGRVRINLDELFNSPKIAQSIAGLKGQEKDGRTSEAVVRELTQAFRNNQYSEDQERDPIYIQLVKLADGNISFVLNGGRHRLVAAKLAGLDQIEVELNSREGFVDQPTEEKYRKLQVHSKSSDQKRANTRQYNSEARVV